MLPQDRALPAPQMDMAKKKICTHMLIQASTYHYLQLLAINILLDEQIETAAA